MTKVKDSEVYSEVDYPVSPIQPSLKREDGQKTRGTAIVRRVGSAIAGFADRKRELQAQKCR